MSTDVPFCSDCDRWLTGRRLVASALVLVPMVVLSAFAARAGTTFAAAVAGAYGLYLFRQGGYGWADALVFGGSLETSGGQWIPRHPDGDTSVRFPGGFRYATLRVGSALVVGSIAFLGSSASKGASTFGNGGITILEILDDGRSLYLPLQDADARSLTFEEGKLAVANQRPPVSGSYEAVSSWRALKDVTADPTARGMLLRRSNGEDVVIPRDECEWLIGQLPKDRPGTEPVVERRK